MVSPFLNLWAYSTVAMCWKVDGRIKPANHSVRRGQLIDYLPLLQSFPASHKSSYVFCGYTFQANDRSLNKKKQKIIIRVVVHRSTMRARIACPSDAALEPASESPSTLPPSVCPFARPPASLPVQPPYSPTCPPACSLAGPPATRPPTWRQPDRPTS